MLRFRVLHFDGGRPHVLGTIIVGGSWTGIYEAKIAAETALHEVRSLDYVDFYLEQSR
jgi:hypothetical protein